MTALILSDRGHAKEVHLLVTFSEAIPLVVDCRV